MSSNNPSRPSRWGSESEARDRSQSWNERAPPDTHQPGRGYDPSDTHQPGRGYHTTNTGGPPPYSRDREFFDRDRFDDRCNFDRGGRRDSRGNDWRCTECGIFNDPRNERCHRCREWGPRDGGWHGRDRGRDDGDYYGPSRTRDYDDDHDGRSRKKCRPEPKKPEWPPAFEDGGAAYVFDARSGMFYEPASDFFYDPKTKMYYSNKKQKYFQFVKGMDPEFQAVESQQQANGGNAGVSGQATSNASDAAANQSANSNTDGSEKSKIAISLKTTALPSSSATETPASSMTLERSKLIEKLRKASSAPVSATPAEPQVDKMYAKNMDVWTNRIKEMKGEASDAAATQQASEAAQVKTTASGQPICALCRRKFANLKKLRQHEELSAMHKENLAKKAAADAKKEAATPECTYRDRTKERQLMYSASSTDTTHVDKLLASVIPTASAEKKAEVIRPEQALGDTNVGNQLLQKMGWKNGESLGRKQEGGDGEEHKARSNVANNLKNDWERIESLAQAGGRQGRH